MFALSRCNALTISAGAGGNEDAHPAVAFDVRVTLLSHGRHVGKKLRALFAGDGKRAHGAFLDVLHGGLRRAETDWRMSGDDRRHRRPAAAKGHVNEVEAERQAELFAGEMCLRAGTRRTEAVFAGIGSDERDELVERLCRHGGIDGEHGRRGDGERDRLEVVDRVVGQAREQRRIDHMRAEREEDGVAVGRRFRHLGGADVSRRAGDVLDIELLAELLRELLRHQPPESVGHPAGRKRHHGAHWPIWIGLRPSAARQARQRGGARGQMEKFAAGKFHLLPPVCDATAASISRGSSP
jgi:hypothetical protein